MIAARNEESYFYEYEMVASTVRRAEIFKIRIRKIIEICSL